MDIPSLMRVSKCGHPESDTVSKCGHPESDMRVSKCGHPESDESVKMWTYRSLMRGM